MTDKPIIFSGPMIHALLDGRKTQTRRAIRNAPTGFYMDRVGPTGFQWTGEGGLPKFPYVPPHAPGDRLWVREAWRSCVSLDHLKPREIGDRASEAGYKRPWGPVFYEADDCVAMWPDCAFTDTVGRYRHPRFMPRWASRLTLTVTDVRVQRVQEISEADAQAEGAVRDYVLDEDYGSLLLTEKHSFATLWDSLNAKRPGCSWGDNPWVVAYSFTVHRCNIDQMEPA